MSIRKKILVTCGAGAVTSAIVEEKLINLAAQHGWNLSIVSCNVREVSSYLSGVDIIITTTPLENIEGVPILQGIPFISGIGADKLEQDLVKLLS